MIEPTEYRTKWGAIPGFCPCGNALSLSESEDNDGLCDGCFAGDDDDDDDDWRRDE